MTPEAGEPKKKGMPVPIIIVIVLAVAFVLCSCIGILAAIAIPNFIRFQARSKQAECKTALKGAYVAEKSYLAEKDRYSENPEEIGYSHDGTRSVLLFSNEGQAVGRTSGVEQLVDGIRVNVNGPLGVTGKCPDCNITIACALNADNDEQVDVWTISTAERTSRSGRKIAAGSPYNDYSDVTDQEGE
ncbi:MAG: hypothetical protein JNK82_26560 [Myxococcaceae bacterium]|nr:hypothetical protein [Myxococcaceae bacterium]